MKAKIGKSAWVTSLLVLSMLYLAGCGKKNDPVITPPPIAGNQNPYGGGFGGGGFVGGGGFLGGSGFFTSVSANLYDMQNGQVLSLQNLQLQYADQYQSPANPVISLVGNGLLTVPTSQGQQQIQVGSQVAGTFQQGYLSIRLTSQFIQTYTGNIQVVLDIRNAVLQNGHMYGGQISGNIFGTPAYFQAQ